MSDHPTLQAAVKDRLTKSDGSLAVLSFVGDTRTDWSCTQLAHRCGDLGALVAETVGDRRVDSVRVALVAENRPNWVAAALAVVANGWTLVPIDSRISDTVLRGILADCRPDVVLHDELQAQRLAAIAEAPTIAIDATSVLPSSPRDPALLALGQHRNAKPDDVVAIFYTSGTTGPPKGVPVSHANLWFSLQRVLAAGLVVEADRVLVPLPYSHAYPFAMGLLVPFLLGVPIVLPEDVSGSSIRTALRSGGVTMVLGVPRLFEAVLSGIEARLNQRGRVALEVFARLMSISLWLRKKGINAGKRLLRPLHREIGPHVRLVTSGGSALDPVVGEQLWALGWDVATGYGLTETAPLLAWNVPGEGRLATAGRPIDGVEIRIASDSTGPGGAADQEAELRGEIQARGPNIFAGYLNRPDATQEAFTDDGWLRTGDRGWIDADGFLHIEGRVSSMIITPSGEKVQPDEVEEAYATEPAIHEIGVLQHSRQLAALVVPDVTTIGTVDDAAIDKEVRAALERARRRVETYKQVTDYAITRRPLPRTRLGKLQRHILAERFLEAHAGREAQAGPISITDMEPQDRALLDRPGGSATWEWLAERFSSRSLSPDASFRLDLGVDSLEWMTLSLELEERTGVTLTERQVADIDSVRDLLRMVVDRYLGDVVVDRSARDPLSNPDDMLSAEQLAWLEPLGGWRRAVGDIMFAVNRALVRALFDLEVVGLDHVPRTGVFIIAPNHVSYLDPFIVAASLEPAVLRRAFWAGWQGVAFDNPATRAVSRLAQGIPMDPEQGAASSLALAAAVLTRGHPLIIFPEGRRSSDGELLPLRRGVGILMERFDVGAVPVILEGAYELMPPGQSLPRRGKIRVSIGSPVKPPATGEAAQPGAAATARLDGALRGLKSPDAVNF